MERNLRNVLHILSNLKHEGGEEILFDEGCKLKGIHLANIWEIEKYKKYVKFL